MPDLLEQARAEAWEQLAQATVALAEAQVDWETSCDLYREITRLERNAR